MCHPDSSTGNAQAFRRLQKAYQQLQRQPSALHSPVDDDDNDSSGRRGATDSASGSRSTDGRQTTASHNKGRGGGGDEEEEASRTTSFYDHPHHRPWMHSARTRVDEHGHYHTEGMDEAAFKRWSAAQAQYADAREDPNGVPAFDRVARLRAAWLFAKWTACIGLLTHLYFQYVKITEETKARHASASYTPEQLERIMKVKRPVNPDLHQWRDGGAMEGAGYSQTAAASSSSATSSGSSSVGAGAVSKPPRLFHNDFMEGTVQSATDGQLVDRLQAFNAAQKRYVHAGAIDPVAAATAEASAEAAGIPASVARSAVFKEPGLPPALGLTYKGMPFTAEGIAATRNRRRNKNQTASIESTDDDDDDLTV